MLKTCIVVIPISSPDKDRARPNGVFPSETCVVVYVCVEPRYIHSECPPRVQSTRYRPMLYTSLMRDEGRKEGRKKQARSNNNKAKQHSTPKAVTFPKLHHYNTHSVEIKKIWLLGCTITLYSLTAIYRCTLYSLTTIYRCTLYSLTTIYRCTLYSQTVIISTLYMYFFKIAYY